nr:hypothetical protein [Kibdelosporangium sp. MJ126-NF4]
MAEDLRSRTPTVVSLINSQRQFLTAAVTHMLDHGVRQFVDLGSGLPTAGHIHHIAHRRSATTVYVDNDTSTVAQAEIVLDGNPHATVLRGDLTQPEVIVASIDRDTSIDRDQPVGLFLVGTLDVIPALTRPRPLLAAYREAFPNQFHLAITLLAAEPSGNKEIEAAARIFGDLGSTVIARPRRTLQTWLSKTRPRGTVLDTGFTLPHRPENATAAAITLDFAVVRYP